MIRITKRQLALIRTYKILQEAELEGYRLTEAQLEQLHEEARIIVCETIKPQDVNINSNPLLRSMTSFFQHTLTQLSSGLTNGVYRFFQQTNIPVGEIEEEKIAKEECILFAALLHIQYTQEHYHVHRETVEKLLSDFCRDIARHFPSLKDLKTAANAATNYDVRDYLKSLISSYNANPQPHQETISYRDLKPAPIPAPQETIKIQVPISTVSIPKAC